MLKAFYQLHTGPLVICNSTSKVNLILRLILLDMVSTIQYRVVCLEPNNRNWMSKST